MSEKISDIIAIEKLMIMIGFSCDSNDKEIWKYSISAIEEIATLKAENEALRKSQIVWHMVEDGLPTKDCRCIVALDVGSIDVDYFYIESEFTNIGWTRYEKEVIAWAELPVYKESK